jgi:hypothetical protein
MRKIEEGKTNPRITSTNLTPNMLLQSIDLRDRLGVRERGRVLLSQVRWPISVGVTKVNEERGMREYL